MLAAKLEVRQKRLDSARKILGMALGMAPKDKTFKAYIELELQLGNIDRCVCVWGGGGGRGGGTASSCLLNFHERGGSHLLSVAAC